MGLRWRLVRFVLGQALIAILGNCHLSMRIQDHHPLILQRDEGQGHKVKVKRSRKLIFREGVC